MASSAERSEGTSSVDQTREARRASLRQSIRAAARPLCDLETFAGIVVSMGGAGSSNHAVEVAAGDRYGFGANWSRFLSSIDDDRIATAQQSLVQMLSRHSLEDCSFVDVGSGSGLFSLVARRLGARVLSFDYDPQSVACTTELRSRYFPDDPDWRIESGSVLDRGYIESLSRHDVVYSWGVLHHTGDMWTALDHAALLVEPGGQLFVAIYNEQGLKSRLWTAIKRFYCSSSVAEFLVKVTFIPLLVVLWLLKDVVSLKSPVRRYTEYSAQNRGMSVFYDWLDWLGGYPFETATSTQLIEFFQARGFRVEKDVRTAGRGNNQLVFRRGSERSNYC